MRRSTRVVRTPNRYSPPPIDFEDDFGESDYDSDMDIDVEGFSDISDSESDKGDESDGESLKDFVVDDDEVIESSEEEDEEDEDYDDEDEDDDEEFVGDDDD